MIWIGLEVVCFWVFSALVLVSSAGVVAVVEEMEGVVDQMHNLVEEAPRTYLGWSID